MTKTNQRKTVEVGRKRIPLRKLIHGKEIREAAKALEDFRLTFNEQEIMFGAKLTITMDTYGEAILVANRPESDNEMAKRLEKARLAEEAEKERERKRKLAEAIRAKNRDEDRKKQAVITIENLIQNNGLTARDFAAVLKLVDKTK
jgi:uncharacterized protein YlxW (UPF0749 family)